MWAELSQPFTFTRLSALLSRVLIGQKFYPQTAQEGTAEVTPTNYYYPPGHVMRYGAVGDGETDDTDAFNDAFKANKGQTVHIPLPPTSYLVPNGLTVSSHTLTRVTCDPNAGIKVTSADDPALTLHDCIAVDFDLPNITCAGSGILITSDNAQTCYNRIGVHTLTGPGKLAAKPADPMTGTTVGIHVQGAAAGNANYYHLVKPGSFIEGFDTGIAFETPSGGIMNANACTALAPHIEGFWFGFYTNCAENQCIGAGFYDTDGTSADALAECVRIGDGTYAANFNRVIGVSETGGSYVRSVNLLANSTGNQVEFQDNEAYSVADAGAGNTVLAHSSAQWGKATTFEQNVTIGAPDAGDALSITALAGARAIVADASAAGSVGLRVLGSAAGTPAIQLNTQAATGTAAATMADTKPGDNSSNMVWIPVQIDGGTYYVPAWT